MALAWLSAVDAPARALSAVLSVAGTLSDGTVFDSSRDRGEPTEFKLNQVIKGWQEGTPPRRTSSRPSSRAAPAQLTRSSRAAPAAPRPARSTARRAPHAGLALMKPGSRAKLTIPAELAYGPVAMGSIPANSVLCFDVELLEVKEAGGFKLPF